MSPKKNNGFTAEEKAAMKERAKELKAQASREEALNDLLAKIAEMDEPDRSMATRIHELITTNVPVLEPKTWYGMPAYARDGKVICFYQSAQKFKSRYSTFGFSDAANLDDGDLWPAAYALTKLTDVTEKKILALVKQAVSEG